MNLRIEELPIQYFAYMRRVGAYGKENYKLMAKFKEWMKSNNHFNTKTTIYGVARDNIQTTSSENCRYDVGMIVDESFNSKELNMGTIDKGKYLTFQIEHTVVEVQNFWTSLFNTLLKENYQFDETRLVLEKYKVELIEKGFCEFCVPVK